MSGLSVQALEPLRLMPGAVETITTLRKLGMRLVVISGTLDILIDTLLPDHPFDEVYANRIMFDESGSINGWESTPFDMDGKAVILRQISERDGIPLDRCAFIGDGTNDLWIARLAGMSVAFSPKCEKLEAEADTIIDSGDLRDVLPHIL